MGQPFSTGAFTETSLSLTCNTTYYSRAYATNPQGTSYGAISSSFTTKKCNPTVTPITITSDNASTSLAKVGDIVTVTFTSDQTSLIAPTVSVAGHATTTAINTSGNIWAASTTMITGDTEGTVPFLLNVGNSDGYGTTTASAVTGSNPSVYFDKTAPVVTISGSNPDTQYSDSRNAYADAGATATDSHDGALSVSTSGSVTLTTSGTQTLTYTATDAAGNSSSASRSVTVVNRGNGPTVVAAGGGLGGPVAVALPNNGGAPAPAVPSTTQPVLASLVLQLQSLIAQLEALGHPVSADIESQMNALVAPASPASSFSRDLRLNDTGDDVLRLQQFLNTHGFIITNSGSGAPGNETDFFGSLTRKALAQFQNANGLPATGYFGPMTRAVIARLEGDDLISR